LNQSIGGIAEKRAAEYKPCAADVTGLLDLIFPAGL
jgi:hypothetical protein